MLGTWCIHVIHIPYPCRITSRIKGRRIVKNKILIRADWIIRGSIKSGCRWVEYFNRALHLIWTSISGHYLQLHAIRAGRCILIVHLLAWQCIPISKIPYVRSDGRWVCRARCEWACTGAAPIVLNSHAYAGGLTRQNTYWFRQGTYASIRVIHLQADIIIPWLGIRNIGWILNGWSGAHQSTRGWKF